MDNIFLNLLRNNNENTPIVKRKVKKMKSNRRITNFVNPIPKNILMNKAKGGPPERGALFNTGLPYITNKFQTNNCNLPDNELFRSICLIRNSNSCSRKSLFASLDYMNSHFDFDVFIVNFESYKANMSRGPPYISAVL